MWDRAQKQIHFALANINSTIIAETNPLIALSQNRFVINSLVKYNKKAVFTGNFDQISGMFNTNNLAPSTFELKDIKYSGEFNYKNLGNPTDKLEIKEATIAFEDGKIKAENIVKSGSSTLNNLIHSSNGDFTIQTLTFSKADEEISFKDLKLYATFDPQLGANPHYYQMNATGGFQECNIKNGIYGPLDFDYSINNIFIKNFSPSTFNQQIAKIKNPSEILAIFQHYREATKENLEFNLNTFKLHIPDGELDLKGNLTVSPKTSEEISGYSGKLVAKISKNAMDAISNSDPGIKSMFLLLRHMFLIDGENTYQSYLVYKNNKLFINGSSLNDQLSLGSPPTLKYPSSKEDKLTIAVWFDDFSQVKKLLSEGVSPNTALSNGNTPLLIASLMGNREIVKLLLDKGAPINQTNPTGNTALFWAARSGHTEIAQDLLSRGANADIKNEQGWTPLQEAAENGSVDIIHLLISKNVDINAQDKEGRTALFWAALNGHAGAVELLLQNGANPSIANIRDKTPLAIAKEKGHIETVQLLERALINTATPIAEKV
jgi:ankyrin repeat protein